MADDDEDDGEDHDGDKEERDGDGEEEDGARGGDGRGARIALVAGADGRLALDGVERGVLAEPLGVRGGDVLDGGEVRGGAVVVDEHDARVLVHAAVAPEPVARRVQHCVARAEDGRHVRGNERLKVLERNHAPVRHRQPKEELRSAPRPPRGPAKRQLNTSRKVWHACRHTECNEENGRTHCCVKWGGKQSLHPKKRFFPFLF